MKTERNGILETAWRKFNAFLKTPLFNFFFFFFMFCASSILVALGMEIFPSVDSIPYFFFAGFFFSYFLLSFLSFLDFLCHCKTSAEADLNKNQNKE